MRPALVAALCIFRASATLSAGGFSHMTCLPARSAAIVIGACKWFGRQTLTASRSTSSISSRALFAARVIDIVRARFPLVQIEPAEDTFSLSVNGSLAPLENLYRMTSLRPDDIQRHVERWAVELLRAAEGTPDDEANYEDVKDRIMPMVLPASARETNSGVVHEPLIPGLIVAYAIDHDRTISYLPKHRFSQWKISMSQLHETAITNLSASSEAIEARAAQDESGQVNLILFQTMDGYDASRLLLPTLHE